MIEVLATVIVSQEVNLQGIEKDDSGVYRSVVPNLFGTRAPFRGRQFFHGPWGGGGFEMIQAHYIYCALYFYYYYIVIYNEIIIQLTIMQNQWEP